MVWNQTSILENSSIRKSYVARNENSNEYHVDVFRPQMIFSVCFGYGYPYARVLPAILCFPASVSVWHWCTLRNSWRWTEDVGFWWIQLLCRYLYTIVIPFYSVHSKNFAKVLNSPDTRVIQYAHSYFYYTQPNQLQSSATVVLLTALCKSLSYKLFHDFCSLQEANSSSRKLKSNNSVSHHRHACVRQSIFSSPVWVKGKSVFSILWEYAENLACLPHWDLYIF